MGGPSLRGPRSGTSGDDRNACSTACGPWESLVAIRFRASTRCGFQSFSCASRRRHTTYIGDWSSDVCSSDLEQRREKGDRLDAAVFHGARERADGAPFVEMALVDPLPSLMYRERLAGSGRIGPAECNVLIGAMERQVAAHGDERVADAFHVGQAAERAY